jgi:LacI family transcriptional regulator
MVKQPPSIVHVAEKAGVSVATASRVMSNSTYPVSPETRQKVLKAATELGYAPNSLARGLRSQRSKLLAAIVGDNTDPYFAEIMRGVEEVANEHGYLTIVCNTDRDPRKEITYLQTLRDYRADGIIFAGGGLNDPHHANQLEEIVKEMMGRGAAVITLSPHTLHVPSIQIDNFQGARMMTSYLLDQGHRRIAFVAGPSNLTVANVRLQGYMAAMVERGLNIEQNLIIAGNFDQPGGERAALHIAQMSSHSRPTAIFAANDETAFGIMLGLARLGWHVPQDISVCGFGDLPMARLLSPPLTTVQVSLRDLGRMGAQKLFAMLKHEAVSELDILSTKVVERGSTAPL